MHLSKRLYRKTPFPRATKRQNPSKFYVSKMSPQTRIFLNRVRIYIIFLVKYCNLQKNIGPVEDSMYGTIYLQYHISIICLILFTALRDLFELGSD